MLLSGILAVLHQINLIVCQSQNPTKLHCASSYSCCCIAVTWGKSLSIGVCASHVANGKKLISEFDGNDKL